MDQFRAQPAMYRMGFAPEQGRSVLTQQAPVIQNCALDKTYVRDSQLARERGTQHNARWRLLYETAALDDELHSAGEHEVCIARVEPAGRSVGSGPHGITLDVISCANVLRVRVEDGMVRVPDNLKQEQKLLDRHRERTRWRFGGVSVVGWDY